MVEGPFFERRAPVRCYPGEGLIPAQSSSNGRERAMTLNDLQAYMVHEYVADYNAGHLSRRDLVRRVLNITGGLGSTATLLLALGCSQPAAQPTSAPAATTAPPKPTTAAAAPPAP